MTTTPSPDLITPTVPAVRAYIERLCASSFLYVHLEPTNACNAHCVMCPRDAMERRPRMLSWDVFLRTMELVLPTEIPMISVVGFGEPTLHGELTRMLAHIRLVRPDMIIKLTTNASRLRPEYIDELYAAGLDLLELSAVGIDPGEYRRTMLGLSFDTLLQAIDHLNQTERLFLVATFPTNRLGTEELRAVWQARGVRHVEVKGFHRRGGHLDQDRVLSADALGDYRARRRESGEEIPVDACHKLYLFLHVNAEGSLIPCVQEINNRNVLCNVADVPDFATLRSILRSARPTFDICRGCELKEQDLVDYYARFLCRYFPQRTLGLLAAESTKSE